MNIAVIGAGFGGLSAAAYLAKAGHKVVVFEQNDQPGGRAREYKEQGFTFDCGPSWYFMPDVFAEFLADFDHTPADFYQLSKLLPSYRVYDHEGFVDVRSGEAGLKDLEGLDAGAGPRLAKLLDQLAEEYETARSHLLNTPDQYAKKFFSPEVLKLLARVATTGSFRDRARRISVEPMAEKILTFMSVFLGSAPATLPGLYSWLNGTIFNEGVWYPQGGFAAVARAFEAVAKEEGVKIFYKTPVQRIRPYRDKLEIKLKKGVVRFDRIVANADMHYVETQLLEADDRSITAEKWAKRKVSPSCIVGLIGVKRKLDLKHHTLFFDAPWEENIAALYKAHRPSAEPLFFVTAPSVTDAGVAPAGHEALQVMIPVPSGVTLSPEQAELYIDSAIVRIEKAIGQQIASHIVVKKIFGPRDHEEMFHAYRGNAFGLSHTPDQIGPWRPKSRSRTLAGLYYVGHYTNPGASVPLVILSGKTVAGVLERDRVADMAKKK